LLTAAMLCGDYLASAKNVYFVGFFIFDSIRFPRMSKYLRPKSWLLIVPVFARITFTLFAAFLTCYGHGIVKI